MRRRFGTDGMRGVAGEEPLDPATLYRLGRALVTTLREERDVEAPAICIGQDTRESCRWIASTLAQGIRSAGGRVTSAGVLPTPGLALLVREGDFDAGAMISASHNPWQDNGVKLFDHGGSKLPDEVEGRIEARLDAEPFPPGPPEETRLAPDPALHARYLDFLLRCLEGARLDGLRVVLDTAHGAAFELAPEAFRAAGAEVIPLATEPNGRNINDGVGSLHPEVMAAAVRDRGADLGFSFDGDADRCIAASARGTILDGDFVLWYAGRAFHAAGRLPGATVVATVMSNLGLEKALASRGIRMLRAPVGDRYVLEAMREGGYSLGGEQSGHVIFLDYAPTGDGILTALTLARLWRAGEGDLDEALAEIPRFPQVLRNVRVREKPPIESVPALAHAIRRAEEQLGEDGRVVVRYSGTEPKARVMIEAADADLVDRLVDEICAVFERELGA